MSLSPTEAFIRSRLQHYNSKKYWKYRNRVVTFKKIKSLWGGVKLLYCNFLLFYIKRCDAFNNASLGTHIGYGAEFGSIPRFPHGLYNIIISHNASIGSGAVIFHGVTIGEGKNGAPTIGDNVLIGAGAIIIGNIHIGNNVKIGAGCVVTHDIPDNATVVSAPAVIIEH